MVDTLGRLPDDYRKTSVIIFDRMLENEDSV